MLIGTANEFQRKNRILVCAVAAYLGKPVPPSVMRMVKSCKKFGIQLALFAVDKEYHGFYVSNLEEQRRCLEVIKNDYAWVLSIDAFDSMFIRGLEDVFEYAPKDCMFFNAERNNYPDASMAYPPCPTSYRYLNGGCFFGPMNLVMDCMNKQTPNWCNCNQYAWAKAYTDQKLPIKIDMYCDVFQTLWGHGKKDFDFSNNMLYNKETHSFPSILHGNGNNYANEVFEWFS